MSFFKKYYDSWIDYFNKKDRAAGKKAPDELKNKLASINAATRLSYTPDKAFYTPKARVYNEWSKFEKAVNSAKKKLVDFFNTQHGLRFKLTEYKALKKEIDKNALAMARLEKYYDAFKNGAGDFDTKFQFTNPVDGITTNLKNLKDVEKEMKKISESTASLTKNLNTMFSGVKKFAATLKVTIKLLGTIFAVLLPIIALATGIKWSKEMA